MPIRHLMWTSRRHFLHKRAAMRRSPTGHATDCQGCCELAHRDGIKAMINKLSLDQAPEPMLTLRLRDLRVVIVP